MIFYHLFFLLRWGDEMGGQIIRSLLIFFVSVNVEIFFHFIIVRSTSILYAVIYGRYAMDSVRGCIGYLRYFLCIFTGVVHHNFILGVNRR